MLKIISGGQTGVDRAALDAALRLNIACGGYCPKGRKCEDGVIPARYPLTETPTDDYAERTAMNVSAGDGTLVLVNEMADKGTALTIELCAQQHKPCIVINLPAIAQIPEVRQWIQQNKINILNVAGNRESSSPGIGKMAFEFLLSVLEPGLKPET